MSQQFIDLGEPADKSKWPEGVRAIGIGEMDRLGVGPNDALYWDGRMVEVRKTITLTKVQRTWAAVLAIAGLLAALGAVVQGATAGHTWACDARLLTKWCKPQQK